MKLTNISLAILVALGLAACGGSDDKTPQTSDNQEAGHNNQTPTGGDETSTPPKDKSGLVPERAAPDMSVPDDIKNIVATRKTIFVDRTFTDSALGYAPASDFSYDENQGTDPANVKTTSMYNFAAERDVVKEDVVKIEDKNAIYTQESLGAIHVGKDPANPTNNAFVKTKGGYVRVATKKIEVIANDNDKKDENKGYRPTTPFYKIKGYNSANGKVTLDTTPIKQSDVIFIANAKTDSGAVGMVEDTTNKKRPLDLGKEKNADGNYQYNPKANEVSLTRVKVFDQTYDIGIDGQNIDFGKLPRKAEIQTQEVTGEYQVRNGKGTGSGNDNFVVNKKIKLGNIKAYNLPYAVAFVTTNVDKDNPSPKDIFRIEGGAFQVAGFKTIALPKQGRAKYTGKSFNESVEGDVELIADFFNDRAGVSGSVLNRKDKDGNTLANLTLDEISLTSPRNHSTGGNAAVKGDPSYADVWTVNFYGQDAEEAAGYIGVEVSRDKDGNLTAMDVAEVYNTQRKELTNQSNTADVK